ncbi:MAG: ribonuclease HII [Bacteroidetes bacterium]|nr:ribonuclease HII [Bacteroidota bacterium]MBV6461159.1 Ribonuclease HII [Flavobacteriales bacterium]WKZ75431.1 MAG: ribonuclease HII [Vicingaceae bacterium]MCL4815004.1 ribonuclease HII [Flavobacteriales bacterium]NOG96135.1 ribonuclease HII [Bacteroidota bacterium]
MFNLSLCYNKNLLEAGCDEAGRGCLAGPVFAAAVILPNHFICKGLNDSKKISEKERDTLRLYIEKKALAWAVAKVDNNEIDKINILNASIKAMHLALAKLKVKPEYIIVDGNRFKAYKNIPHTCIVKGDGKYMNIAAASILAKTHRDEFMLKQHKKFPQYGWDKNKGYPTKIHREAIKVYGQTHLHRKSFRLLAEPQLTLNF